ncbi:MAG: hypothetical protein WBO24_01560 [Nitrospirales bacterium]
MPFAQRLISCLVLMCAALTLAQCTHAPLPAEAHTPTDLPILAQWSGNYPVTQLDQLPEGQTMGQAGYLGSSAQFRRVWSNFKPGEAVPQVNFDVNLVVFTRNIAFYNRINILKIPLNDGVADIIAMETRSAQPIENHVAMAMAVIPRKGIQYILAGQERVPISDAH